MAELNPAITHSEVIIFAGAGTSRHLGYPLASELLEMLRQHFDSPAKDAVHALYHAIDAQGDENFEHVFERAKYLRELTGRDAQTALDMIGGVDSVSGSPREMVAQWVHSRAEWSEVASELWGELHRVLVGVFGDPERGKLPAGADWWDSPTRTWCGFLGQLCARSAVLPVFTTNYDLGLYDLRQRIADQGLRIVDGTLRRELPRGRADWYVSPDAYHDLRELEGGKVVAIFRLHGSVAWQSVGKGAPEGATAKLAFSDEGLPEVDTSKAVLLWPTPCARTADGRAQPERHAHGWPRCRCGPCT